MNRDLQLQVQAYVDAELAVEDVRRVEALLATDPTAKALFEELKSTHAVLRSNELELKLPEDREFYWSKISRQIENIGTESAIERSPVLLPWLRWLIPSAALGIVLLAFTLTGRFEGGPKLAHLRASAGTADVETPLEESSLIAFRSEAEGISVVWVNTQ